MISRWGGPIRRGIVRFGRAGTGGGGGGGVDRPESTNTGLSVEMGGALSGLSNQAGGSLSANTTYSGKNFTSSLTVNSSGTTITGCQINGDITLGASGNNCTVKNCLVNGSIYNQNGATNLLVENTEVTHPNGETDKGILIGNGIVRKCYIHDVGSDGIWTETTSSLVIEYCYVTRCGKYRSADHIDGIQFHNAASGVIVRYNHIKVPQSFYSSGEGATWPWASSGGGLNSCLTFQSDWGAISDCEVYGNWFQGGSYTLRLEAKGGNTVTGINLHDNSSGTDYEYGVFKADSPDASAADPTYTASNNRRSYPNAASTGDALAFS